MENLLQVVIPFSIVRKCISVYLFRTLATSRRNLHYKTDNIKEISKDFGNAITQSPGRETKGRRNTETAGATAESNEKAAANAAGGAEKTAAKSGKRTAAAAQRR